MNQSQFISEVAEKLGLTKIKTKEVLEGIAAVILKGVHDHENIAFPDMGRFSKKITKDRTCRNPRTGELMKVASKAKLVFTPTASAKEKLANQHKK